MSPEWQLRRILAETDTRRRLEMGEEWLAHFKQLTTRFQADHFFLKEARFLKPDVAIDMEKFAVTALLEAAKEVVKIERAQSGDNVTASLWLWRPKP